MIKFCTHCLAFVLVLSSFVSNAQSETNENEPKYLIDLSKTKLTGFGSIQHEISLIDGNIAYTSGSSGAFLFDYSFFAGIYSMSLNSRHMREDIYPADHNPETNIRPVLASDNMVCFNHGGAMVGYIFNHNKLFHLSSNVKIGRGKLALADRRIDFSDLEKHHIDRVAVITPEVDMEMNVTRWCKFGLSAGYRMVLGVNSEEYVNELGESKPVFEANQFSSTIFSFKASFGIFGPKRSKSNNNL